ncbi:cAMP-dependent protein kinase catalytic subunit 1-like [Planococcus citri]|uniref:cAMP-dependent protein kinase catalytic subunit 1-like n=1 Tax=Planococcus citri TaxID=170843 RepID=UPI0031F95467
MDRTVASSSSSHSSRQSIASDMKAFLRKAKKKFEEKWSRNISPKVATTDDFKSIKTVGTGHFGRVVFAQHRPSKRYYALKILEKGKVIDSNQLQHVKNEKKILQCVHFPFLVTLKYNFKDNCNLYMALDFVPGGEMFSHLQHFRRFNENMARFYTSQVVLSFEYLHHLGIIYRDLKPENLLLDSKGYLKITDFGFAKKIDNRRTWTRCGTTEYLAPEVVLRKGYSYSVDWWTVGILMYEMTNGQPPFKDKKPEDVYTKIIAGKITYPAHMSRQLRSIISEFLKIDVTKRLGSRPTGGVEDVKKHPFFVNINWMAMLQKKYPAPIVPPLNGPTDTSNFPDYEELPILRSPNELFSTEFEDF